jgi:hypothetical protein
LRATLAAIVAVLLDDAVLIMRVFKVYLLHLASLLL